LEFGNDSKSEWNFLTIGESQVLQYRRHIEEESHKNAMSNVN